MADLAALLPLALLTAAAFKWPAWWSAPLTPRTWDGPVREHEAVRSINSAEER